MMMNRESIWDPWSLQRMYRKRKGIETFLGLIWEEMKYETSYF